MADIVDIAEFKAKKLEQAELEFNMYMTKADELKRAGKHKFADELLAKAKEVRKTLDKLRGKPKVATISEIRQRLANIRDRLTPHTKVNITYTGHAGIDLGYPKTTTFPVQTPLTTPPA
jgi:phage shock protein A